MLTTIFSLIILFFSMIIHEIAHGSVAFALGDPTAKDAGRLTLNPLRHLDPFGSIILPLIFLLTTFGQGPIFGWTKPVPINPYNLRDQKWGILKISIAGPTTNFLIAIIFGLVIRFLTLPQSILIFFSIITIYNFAWGLFNLIPLPPADGSHILFTFLPERFSSLKFFLQRYGLFIIIFLVFFGFRWIFQAAMVLFTLVSGQSFII